MLILSFTTLKHMWNWSINYKQNDISSYMYVCAAMFIYSLFFFFQKELGEVVYAQLPEVEDTFNIGGEEPFHFVQLTIDITFS